MRELAYYLLFEHAGTNKAIVQPLIFKCLQPRAHRKVVHLAWDVKAWMTTRQSPSTCTLKTLISWAKVTVLWVARVSANAIVWGRAILWLNAAITSPPPPPPPPILNHHLDTCVYNPSFRTLPYQSLSYSSFSVETTSGLIRLPAYLPLETPRPKPWLYPQPHAAAIMFDSQRQHTD